MRLQACCMLVALLCASPAAAQSAEFDVYVGRVVRSGGSVRIDSLHNATARPGYDNQPHFTADGNALLYTRQSDGQTDIWRYDLATATATALTSTPESEYSPTPLGTGGFAVIRVEADSAQRLWRFDARGASLIFPEVRPVGYQAWLDDSTALLFVLGSPATLQRARIGERGATPIAAGIGRSLQRVPGARRISFVQQGPDSAWITLYDPASADALIPVLPVPAGRAPGGATTVAGEYHAWLPDGTLLATAGAQLFARAPGASEWRMIEDYSEHGWRLSRIAVDARGERIALVIETR